MWSYTKCFVPGTDGVSDNMVRISDFVQNRVSSVSGLQRYIYLLFYFLTYDRGI